MYQLNIYHFILFLRQQIKSNTMSIEHYSITNTFRVSIILYCNRILFEQTNYHKNTFVVYVCQKYVWKKARNIVQR